MIRTDRFPHHILALQPDDLVSVQLNTGGSTEGHILALDPSRLTLRKSRTSIVVPLTPKQVRAVRLIYRASETFGKATSAGSEPANWRESWLPDFARGHIFSMEPNQLWEQRYRHTQALGVVRPFTIPQCTLVSETASTRYFLTSPQLLDIREEDEIKVMGVTDGLERTPTGLACLSEVYLLLRKRGDRVQKIYTPRPLSPSNLSRDHLQAYLLEERMTLVVSRPNPEGNTDAVQIFRVRASTARSYMLHLERLPERRTLGLLRAERSSELAEAEASIRNMYQRLGLRDEADLRRPMIVDLYYPTPYGLLRVLHFRKELALD